MKKFIILVIVTTCFLNDQVYSQETATFSAYLLTSPSGHNCKGTVRFEFHTCDCFWSYAGIDVTVNDGYVGNFGYCPDVPPGSGTSDIQMLPGEYDIIGTLNSSSSCSNTGAQFTYHISIPNPACKSPTMQISDIQPSTGFNCNDGKFTVHVYPTDDCSADAARVRVYDALGNQVNGFDGIWFENDPWGRTLNLKAGKYTVKGFINSPDCTDTVTSSLTIPGPKKCKKPSIVVSDVQRTSGHNCSDGKFSVNVYPSGCGADVGSLRLYDSTGNQVGSFNGSWFSANPWGTIFENLKPGKYKIKGWNNVPNCSDTAYKNVTIKEKKCSAKLTEVSRIDNKDGIYCPDANKLELKFTANACFDAWYLEEATTQQIGGGGSWSAAKDQNIFVSLIELGKRSDKYYFTAHLDDLTCVAVYQPSGFKTKGCDATINSVLVQPASAPTVDDGSYSFTIKASACQFGVPWSVLLKNVNTGEEYYDKSLDVNDKNLTIDHLPAGEYTLSYQDEAGFCKYTGGNVTVPVAAASSSLRSKQINSPNFTATLYPNPAKNVVSINMSNNSKPVSVIIRDLSGKVVLKKENVIGKNISITLQGFAKGTYMVTISDGGQKKVFKLIKAE